MFCAVWVLFRFRLRFRFLCVLGLVFVCVFLVFLYGCCEFVQFTDGHNIPSAIDCWKTCLQSDQFCVKWNVKFCSLI